MVVSAASHPSTGTIGAITSMGKPETTSQYKEEEEGEGGGEIDRISELPEHIIQRIMEFLGGFADLARLSVASKKFFSTWRSFPLQDFDFEFEGKYYDFDFRGRPNKSKIRDSKFVCDSIRSALLLHRPNDNFCLQGFAIFTSQALNAYSKMTRVVEMVNFALQKQVKELELDFKYNQGKRLSCFLELVSSSSSKSITTLKLSGFDLGAQHVALSMPLIEVFTLKKCFGITSIVLGGERLKRVDFYKCYGLEKIGVDGPRTSIDSLKYVGKSYCNISLASTKSVKFLNIWETPITKDWFESNFSRFVENLKFKWCRFRVKSTSRWYFEQLKRLELIGCDCKVEFETPKLEWFSYWGRVCWEIPLVISSLKFDAQLGVSDLNLPRLEEFSLGRFSDFIRYISHCQTLTLLCKSAEDLIYPRALRAQLDPPLNDMKHLKIEFPLEIPYNIVEVIDSLLWLAPHPNTISFTTMQAVTKSIKFNYHDATSKNMSCCSSRRGVKCWPQHLKEVELHKFEDVNESTSLRNYFARTYKVKAVISFHMHE